MRQSEIISLKLKIVGSVQGVGYRYFTLRRARELGISGWVRNEPDGSVSALIQGREPLLLNLIEILKEGPSFGFVKEIFSEPVEELPIEGFRIVSGPGGF